MLLFPNSSCIKESHTSLYCSRNTKAFYILCITTKYVKSQQNYLFKKGYKKAPSMRSKKIFKKEFLHKILIYLF